MLKSLKINIALLICFAFIFRLTFITVGIISSSSLQHNKGFVKSHFSTILKRRNLPSKNSENHHIPVVEICEEYADGDNEFKSATLPVLHLLYSVCAGTIENNLKKVTQLARVLPYTVTNRYLLLQVFRI